MMAIDDSDGQFAQEYTPLLRAPTGESYLARAYVGRLPDGLWEAWLVFFSLETGSPVATSRETTQSTREHALYWATGLGRTYLQGALERALELRPRSPIAPDRLTRRRPSRHAAPVGGGAGARGRRMRD
jgi:hypothetical protein